MCSTPSISPKDQVSARSAVEVPASADRVGPTTTSGRLYFVDNLRVLLTILVLLFHMMIIYAGTGSWAYQEGRQDEITGLIGAWFVAGNQAFFMGLFLLISAYFVPGSYDRKGAGRFLADRLVRLGIPLAIYSWLLDPLLGYVRRVWLEGPRTFTWRDILGHFSDGAWIGSGPSWFIEVLLLFSVFYVLWRRLTDPRQAGRARPAMGASPFPHSGVIVLTAVLLGLASFAARLVWPIGYEFTRLTLQFPFFPQYIALFILGLVAYRRRWFLALTHTQGRTWLVVGLGLIALFPLLAVAGGSIEPFAGGWHWQALAYALWEAFVCLGMCIGLVDLFRQRANTEGQHSAFLVRNAYTAYLIHGIVITVLALALRNMMLYPLLKWALVSLVALPLCWGLSSQIRRLPYADRVL